jgi:uncharacterized membrane protein YagU involved in acid resistance
MYLTSRSFILGIFNIIYCTFYRMWNHITLSNNCNSTYILCFLFHLVEFQLGLIVSVDFKIPCNSCLSPFYWFFRKIIITYLNLYNIF